MANKVVRGAVVTPLVLALFLIVAAAALADPTPRWQLSDCPDVGTGVAAMTFVGDDVGWACTSNSLLHTTDGGQSWSSLAAPEGMYPTDICFADVDHGWVSGYENTIARTTDGGATWVVSRPDCGDFYNVGQLWFSDADHGIAMADGVLIATTDGGVSWQVRNSTWLYGNVVYRYTFTDALNGWGIAGHYPELYRTTDGGANWAYAGVDARDVSFSDALDGMVVGDSGVQTTTDGGTTWTTVAPSSTMTSWCQCLVATDSLHAWLVADGLFATDDGGQTWFRQSVEGSVQGLGELSDLVVHGVNGWLCGSSMWHTTRAMAADMRPPTTTYTAPSYVITPTTIELSATDDQPGTVTTFFRVDDGLWQQSDHIDIAAPIDHGNDGPHKYTVCSVDAAGNDEVGNTFSVVVDTSLPTSVVTPQADGMVDTWRNADAVFVVTGGDVGSGLDRYEYCLDSIGPMHVYQDYYSHEYTVTVEARRDHLADGKHTLQVRAVDVAGNLEPYHVFHVYIDTRLPKAAAPYPSSGKKGGYFTVKFKISDRHPCSGYCAVLIQFFKDHRRWAYIAPKKWYHSNRLQSVRFKSKLPKGHYRFTVRASDGAGNISTNKAANWFIVQ